jgi:hypothetical protein
MLESAQSMPENGANTTHMAVAQMRKRFAGHLCAHSYRSQRTKAFYMTDHTESSATEGSTGGANKGARSTESRARDAASDTGKAAWGEAQSQFAQQSSFAADQTDKVSAVLHNMADEFDQQDQHTFSNYTNQLAGYSDSLSEKLREKDLNYFVDEARNISRRQPALFMGGAIAAGFVLARFLRSSSETEKTASEPDSAPTTHTGVYDAPSNSNAESAHSYGSESPKSEVTDVTDVTGTRTQYDP